MTKKFLYGYTLSLLSMAMLTNCNTAETADSSNKAIQLVTLDPGHFHAALVQKSTYPEVDSVVYVYAPEGQEVETHLQLINQYNSSEQNATNWKEEIYRGNDFLDKMIAEKKGNAVVLAGNNLRKTEYINRSIEAGFHVLADKPMAIDTAGFSLLQESFEKARANNTILFDIMTERFEITNMLQRELTLDSNLFGTIQKGSAADPAVIIESVHYFAKEVSGKPLTRPEWFFDPSQQGESIADVGVHLVDLVQWTCFPEQVIDYKKDITINSSRLWPTALTLSQYKGITKKESFPEFLKNDIVSDTILNTHANGEINYTLKDIFVKVISRWDHKAVEGADTHYAIVRGTKANLVIYQRKEEGFKPTLYVVPAAGRDLAEFTKTLENSIASLGQKFMGILVKKSGNNFAIEIPANLKTTHEEHFAEVMTRFLQYVQNGNMPEWEIPNMLAKYYTTTQSLHKAGK